jgi:hypothetical protein
MLSVQINDNNLTVLKLRNISREACDHCEIASSGSKAKRKKRNPVFIGLYNRLQMEQSHRLLDVDRAHGADELLN